jgi:ribosome-binding factor A
MSREFARSRRVAEQIQRTLAEMLRRELKDPRVANASISEVEVSGDLAHARVFVSLLPPDADPAPALAGLQSAAGFLRHKLGRALKLRQIPTLHFVHDDSIARGAALTHLIDEVVDRDRLRHKDDASEDAE